MLEWKNITMKKQTGSCLVYEQLPVLAADFAATQPGLPARKNPFNAGFPYWLKINSSVIHFDPEFLLNV